jgi:hypothetical protein
MASLSMRSGALDRYPNFVTTAPFLARLGMSALRLLPGTEPRS